MTLERDVECRASDGEFTPFVHLDISSADFSQWDRNLNTGWPPGMEPASAAVVATQAVFHDSARPSRLRLLVDRSRL